VLRPQASLSDQNMQFRRVQDLGTLTDVECWQARIGSHPFPIAGELRNTSTSRNPGSRLARTHQSAAPSWFCGHWWRSHSAWWPRSDEPAAGPLSPVRLGLSARRTLDLSRDDRSPKCWSSPRLESGLNEL